MSKPTSPIVKQPELVVRPYDHANQSLIETEHYALEYARLIAAVHAAVVAESLKELTKEGAADVVARGLIVLGLKYPDTYEAIARNSGAREGLKIIQDAARSINDVLGLSYGLDVKGGEGSMFGVTVF